MAGVRRSRKRARAFLYSAGLAGSYLFQGLGVLWILWVGGVAIWALATHGLANVNVLGMLSVVGLGLAPCAALFFGGRMYRGWVRKQGALWQV